MLRKSKHISSAHSLSRGSSKQCLRECEAMSMAQLWRHQGSVLATANFLLRFTNGRRGLRHARLEASQSLNRRGGVSAPLGRRNRKVGLWPSSLKKLGTLTKVIPSTMFYRTNGTTVSAPRLS